MQNYEKNAESGNIFSQLSEWRTNRAEKLTKGQVEKLANIRNPETNADEVKIVIWALLVVCTLLTMYTGFLFLRETFSQTFSAQMAFMFAVAGAASIEAGKVFLAQRWLRSLLFGFIFEDIWAAGTGVFVLCITVSAFFLSINISTEGLEIFSRTYQERNTGIGPTLSEVIGSATSEIDGQILALQNAQNASLASKWKGTIVYEAQKTATRNGESIGKLQDQRAMIVQAATDDFFQGKTKSQGKIDTWALWVRKFGGVAEYAAIFLLIAFAFLERKLVAKNLDRLNNQASPTPPQNGTKPQPQPEYLNLSERKPLFGNGQTVSQNNTVLQTVKAVTQQEGNEMSQSIDDTLNLARKALNSEIWNLKNENGNPATVAGRIHSTFNRVGRSLSSKSTPSPDVLDSYSDAFERAVQELEAKNLPYEYTNEAITQLTKFTSKAA
jgi:hypothetical protein